MSEQQIPASNSLYVQTETSILDNPYEREVQEDIVSYEKKKTMYALFIIGAVFLIFDAIALSSANLLTSSTMIVVAMVPAIFLGLGLFAKLQPMVAIIIGIIVILAISVINYLSFGSQSLIMGWLPKAIMIYFIITGVRHAKEAEAAKRKLQSLS